METIDIARKDIKRTYAAPRLIVHGTVEEITQQGTGKIIGPGDALANLGPPMNVS